MRAFAYSQRDQPASQRQQVVVKASRHPVDKRSIPSTDPSIPRYLVTTAHHRLPAPTPSPPTPKSISLPSTTATPTPNPCIPTLVRSHDDCVASSREKPDVAIPPDRTFDRLCNLLAAICLHPPRAAAITPAETKLHHRQISLAIQVGRRVSEPQMAR